MKKIDGIKVIKYSLGFLAAAVFAVLSGLGLSEVIDVLAQDELKTATSCSFVIPNEFVPGPEKGLFINRNHPMESSSIKYSYYDNEKDKILTNREKAEALASGEMEIIDESLNLTKEIYQETMSAAYDNEYQEKVGFKVEKFEKIKVDGYHGFKIVSSYQPTDEEVIHQTVYMLISKYRMFTVTYQRAEDDDCEEFFENSAATIHLR
jgi:hypothetical protein